MTHIGPWRRTAASVAILLGAVLLAGAGAGGAAVTPRATGAPAAARPVAAKPGRRVTVAVFGDSIVEGYTIPGFLHYGLVPALGTALVKAGRLEPGGTGLIAVTPFRWRFNRYTVFGGAKPTPDGWILAGYASHGLDGPSGYSAVALGPKASATAPIDSPEVGILFTKFPGGGPFTVTAGASTWRIDGHSTGPAAPVEQWLTMPRGASRITVHGPSSGGLVFDGAVARRPVAAGRVQVEMENLGHMGHTLGDDAAPRIGQSLVAQRFDISIFIAEYIYQYSAQYGDPSQRTRFELGYARALADHLRRLRAYGGRCLIADTSPVPISPIVLGQFAAINQREARLHGCAVTDALAHLWNPATAVHDGFTLPDGSHPTRTGYRLISRALAPIVLGLIRSATG